MPSNHQMAAASATAKAIRRLKEAHPEEWDTFYAEERIRAGLPAQVGPSALQAENQRLRQELLELREKANSGV